MIPWLTNDNKGIKSSCGLATRTYPAQDPNLESYEDTGNGRTSGQNGKERIVESLYVIRMMKLISHRTKVKHEISQGKKGIEEIGWAVALGEDRYIRDGTGKGAGAWHWPRHLWPRYLIGYLILRSGMSTDFHSAETLSPSIYRTFVPLLFRCSHLEVKSGFCGYRSDRQQIYLRWRRMPDRGLRH